MNEATKLVKQDETHLAERRSDEPYRGYGYGAEGLDGEVHLLDYWRAVRKRLWLVIGVAALITALATIYVARKPDVYEASSRVQVDLENNPMYAGKSAPMIYSPVNDPAYFNTQLQILTSPGLLRRVVKTLDLEHNHADVGRQRAGKERPLDAAKRTASDFNHGRSHLQRRSSRGQAPRAFRG